MPCCRTTVLLYMPHCRIAVLLYALLPYCTMPYCRTPYRCVTHFPESLSTSCESLSEMLMDLGGISQTAQRELLPEPLAAKITFARSRFPLLGGG
eukprot:gene9709-biopygen5506